MRLISVVAPGCLASCGFLFAAAAPGTAYLSALPEHLRPNPYGSIVTPDQVAGARPVRTIQLQAARAGYASCHLLARVPAGNPYSLTIASSIPGGSLEVAVYREWFHSVAAVKDYFPDALIPVGLPYQSTLPETDNRIPGQTVQSFWVDVWVPGATAPGDYTFLAALTAGGKTSSLPIRVNVANAIIPAEDAVVIDHNTYGTSWFAEQYPRLRERIGASAFDDSQTFHLIHAYHRMFYEHRGTFHQLGYGHAGKVGPEFAPRLEGSGKNKHIASWAAFDEHYGPLLDGSAFKGTHRGPAPIPYVYLPINPEWPASFEWWGEPGYEREFVNVVSEMEHHFREKRWTHTRFELFFNHKKRYKGFSWDGDEARFPDDYAYLREYSRLLKLAVPSDSPVQFVVRADVSWTMERQWKELSDVIHFWVCSGGMFGWYPFAPQMLKDRGDIVWIYGGTPPVTEASSHITLDVLRPWIQNVNGFVRWLTTSPGPDPWFHFGGGGETLVYPGDRFGIAGPIPSIRLKLERNAVQDLTLLNAIAKKSSLEQAQAGAAKSFNGTDPGQWWTPRPALADGDPTEWSNADIEAATQPKDVFGKLLDSAAWARVHAYIFQRVSTTK